MKTLSIHHPHQHHSLIGYWLERLFWNKSHAHQAQEKEPWLHSANFFEGEKAFESQRELEEYMLDFRND